MERIMRPLATALYSLLLITAAVLALFYPVISRGQLAPYAGTKIENVNPVSADPSKKTVLIIADSKSTEMFDMLAPFNVFSATEQLNVFIVAKDAAPIPLKKDLYVLPQLTFSQVDAQHIKADVIVIPALSARDDHQDPAIVNFIKTHFGSDTRILSICDGASTAAATGLYDGKYLTAHATDYECVKKYWDKPIWTQNVTVAQSGNLYSTAGVANAVEGALKITQDVLGTQAREKAAQQVNYPHNEIQLAHNSQALSFGNKLSILKRMAFSRKKRLGLLLHNGFDELKFASIVDTYSRTYPKEFKTFSLQGDVLTSRNGLTFVHTGGNAINPNMDEVHVIMPESLSEKDNAYFKGFELVTQNSSAYPIDQCLARIGQQFGEHYAYVVKLTLDYN